MNNYRTMSEVATQLIRGKIIKGDYPPGSRLKPAQMEKDMDLGRVAIREGLKELTGSGLVISIPNKGIQVASPPSFEEVAVIYESRYVFEGHLSFYGARNITSDVISRMEEVYQLIESKNATDKSRFLLNRDFHLTLYQESGWPCTCQTVRHLLDQVLVFYAYHTKDMDINVDFRPFNREHHDIIEALKKKDSEEVRQITIDNIKRGYELLIKLSEQLDRAAGY